jgi:hypothetical protein
MVLLNARESDETVALLVIAALAAMLSSVGWMLMTIYQVTTSKKAVVNQKNPAMIAVVLLACASWVAAYERGL